MQPGEGEQGGRILENRRIESDAVHQRFERQAHILVIVGDQNERQWTILGAEPDGRSQIYCGACRFRDTCRRFAIHYQGMGAGRQAGMDGALRPCQYADAMPALLPLRQY
ncbi:hypothetical protein GCM10008942_22120 [Rhizomicrobium electricum]|uniref:4Fe-4S Wbl-type domain-containing protein n=1 Tax=Rhizomicrobium electricum TaxID=480070 RepID=A0ABP3PUY3_9PROT